MSAKKHGRKRWKHVGDLVHEIMACESLLDSMLQKHPKNKQISKALGHIRSAWAKVGYEQKAMSRFVHPAPNQRVKCSECGKRLILDYNKKPLPHKCVKKNVE